MSEDLTYKLISGEVVINHQGTFYFASPGNHIDGDGEPIYEKLHREDGPAAVWSTGAQEWFLNGKRHRENGPAGIYPSGRQYWYLNGIPHRKDGPAAIYSDGRQSWYLNGEELTEEQINERRSNL